MLQYQAGKPAEALKLQLEELRIRRRLQGDEPHPEVARCLNDVGFLLLATGRAEQGLNYFRQS